MAERHHRATGSAGDVATPSGTDTRAAQRRNVIVELRPSWDVVAAALEAGPGEGPAVEALASALPAIPSLVIDPRFPLVAIPSADHPQLAASPAEEAELPPWEDAPETSTVIVRGTISESEASSLGQTTPTAAGQVVGVYIDAPIQPTLICPGSPPLGTDAQVAKLLCASRLHARQMDGSHVLLAVVDTGINRAHLVAHGQAPTIDVGRSWAPPGASGTGGTWPVNHGTMCAFDALIAAPRATILDIAVLQSRRRGGTVMEGLLSDAVLAYRHLLNIMSAPRRPGEVRTMVVTNSWGMFHPSWDYPPGDPRNYSDNPNHPFNRIVQSLDRAGGDILFAAGNCGGDCPDGRCQGVTSNAIYGANSSPYVLTVAGVDTTGQRVGYSSTGPGHLPPGRKPDICGFTHFRGSEVYPADGGTSAATPVVAGVVAAVRSRRPYRPGVPATSTAQLRDLLRTSALHRGAPGWNIEYGYGIVNGCRLASVVTAEEAGTFEGLLGDLEEGARADSQLAGQAPPYATPPVPTEVAPAG